MKTLALLALIVCCSSYAQAKLKFLQVVFRHGDRAPDSNGLESFPKDAHANDTFDPVLRGGLTNEGKMREYNLGAHLRKMYGDFLGDTYYPYEVKARSTNVDRTKMSLQLVLAALYPPKNKQRWNPALDWQPIPATYVPSLDDNLMVPEECPLYLLARERAEQSPEFRQQLVKFYPLMEELSNLTGMYIANTNQLYFLYHTLMAEKSMNLTLPVWAADYFPDKGLLNGTILEYEIASYNTELKRLNGGMFIKRFTDDMSSLPTKEATMSSHNGSRIKLNVYSGHETNVAAVLQALRVYTPHVPEYSSAVFIELHKENGVYYVKAKYYKGIPSEHVELDIPGCGVKCTLEQFKEATKDVYPSDLETICNKRAIYDIMTKSRINVARGILIQIRNAILKEKAEKSTLN